MEGSNKKDKKEKELMNKGNSVVTVRSRGGEWRWKRVWGVNGDGNGETRLFFQTYVLCI